MSLTDYLIIIDSFQKSASFSEPWKLYYFCLD